MSYGGIGFSIQTLFFKIFLLEELKLSFSNLGGMKTSYMRFYEVLPGMSQEVFEKHMATVRKTASKL